MMHLANNFSSRVFLVFVFAIFLLPFSSAGLVELSINDSDDLLISEDEIVFQEGTDLNNCNCLIISSNLFSSYNSNGSKFIRKTQRRFKKSKQ